MALEITNKSAVQAAIDECGSLGRRQFLDRYEFGDSSKFELIQDGRRFPSKAIAGVAHGIAHEVEPLSNAEFSGGLQDTVQKLRSLGFTVVDTSDPLTDLAVTCTRLRLTPTFDAHEVDYKFEMAKTSPITKPGASFDEISKWLGSNNLVRWQTTDRLKEVESLHDSLTELAAELQETDADDSALIGSAARAFSSTPLNPGEKALLVSVSLLSISPIRFPPYRATPASLLAKKLELETETGTPEARYTQFLDLLDATIDRAKTELNSQLTRLDVQGAVWALYRWPLPVFEGWSEEELQELNNWRTDQLPSPGMAAPIWWVNQGKTYAEERASGLVWAPQLQKNGRPAPHHAAVGNLAQGDRIVHYSRGAIRAIGTATTQGFEAEKPQSLASHDWGRAGLQCDVSYDELESPIKLRQISEAVRRKAGGPFNSMGGVNQGYLYSLPPEIWGQIAPLIGETTRLRATTDQEEKTMNSLSELVDDFASKLKASGLDYGSGHESLVRSFVVALATKPFAILSGLSGSGKTRMAMAFGDYIGITEVIPVRPDWNSPEAMLGYENTLSEADSAGRHVWVTPRFLEVMANAAANPACPFIVVLDEMNLAHVERYLADLLSGMESGSAVIPNVARDESGIWRRDDEEPSISVPPNVYLVGTVNVDETTYMFSPKVLDRANTFEFRVRSEDLGRGGDLRAITPAGLSTRETFLEVPTPAESDFSSELGRHLREIHVVLGSHNREFGHRTFNEAMQFGSLLSAAGEPNGLAALDLQVLQKVLPKMHGSQRDIGELLKSLRFWCFSGPGGATEATNDPENLDVKSAVLPLSFEKLDRMIRRLEVNHFVHFSE